MASLAPSPASVLAVPVPQDADVDVVIADRYVLDALVAKGGTSSVYRATDLETGRTVAVKILAPTIAAIPGFRARVLREATVLRNLTSNHSVRVHAASSEASATYLVLELLDGADLRKVLETELTFDVTRAVDVILETCDAVAEAHQLGVVHRDLKPENILLVRDADGAETVKVIDFGIAKLVDVDARERLTGVHVVLGSPPYMAPEQIEGAAGADGRTDVFALGVVLHELLTGSTPFNGASLSELYGSILAGPPAEMPEHVPAALAALLRSALSVHVDARPATVAAFAAALEPFASARGLRAARRIAELAGAPSSRRIAVDGAATTQISLAPEVATVRASESSVPVRPVTVEPVAPPARVAAAAPSAAASGKAPVVTAVSALAPAGASSRPSSRPAPAVRRLELVDGELSALTVLPPPSSVRRLRSAPHRASRGMMRGFLASAALVALGGFGGLLSARPDVVRGLSPEVDSLAAVALERPELGAVDAEDRAVPRVGVAGSPGFPAYPLRLQAHAPREVHDHVAQQARWDAPSSRASHDEAADQLAWTVTERPVESPASEPAPLSAAPRAEGLVEEFRPVRTN